MDQEKTSPAEYIWWGGGMTVGIVLGMTIAVLFLPKGVLLFSLYGAVSAVAGGLAGVFLYKKFGKKEG